jgi:hypothetical protein
VAATDFETSWETTMPDIREQLRRIETSAPPDLWKEIEMRATKNRPEIEPSVIVFRPRGAQVRRRVAAGLLAAAVFALTAVVVWEVSRSAVVPRPRPPQGAAIPEGWEKCTNTTHGYSIAYPGAWHTTDVFDGTPDPANACQWFSPDPFGPQGNVVADGWGYPLELAIRGSSFDDVRAQETDPETTDVLVEEDVLVDGHRAVRLELETLNDVVGENGLHYEYLVELDAETTLIVHTTATRGVTGVYAENKVVLDYAVDTLRF